MTAPDSFRGFLHNYFLYLTGFVLIGGIAGGAYSFVWLYQSGDAAVERLVAAQAEGKFAIFGSGLSQDFVDYKLQLYRAVRPEIVAIGSSRVMQFRAGWFKESFLNMGGVAGNLAILSSTIGAMLAISVPEAVIIGLDFWWFLPQWDPAPDLVIPPTSGSYNYSLSSLKKPWEWLLEGKISLAELALPITGSFGRGFRTDHFGIMAQQSSDGFGPDGSWNYTGAVTGQRKAFDYQFLDTLQNIALGIKAFYHASPGQRMPGHQHIQTLVKIVETLEANKVKVFLFIPPVAAKVWHVLDQGKYPHLFQLAQSLEKSGLHVLDLSNPASIGGNDCEYIDGFHGGEVTYARILEKMAEAWPDLLTLVNMDKLKDVIQHWAGHTLVANPMLTDQPEIDFLGLGCPKSSYADLAKVK